ncbi:MAG: HAD hydrolase-like protein [Thermodesulfobacteriota bacterium]
MSFDVFDTLLIRKIDPPDEVKRIVSNNVERAGLLDISANELLTLRNNCEEKLRMEAQDNKFDPECSIREIMDSVTRDLGANGDVKEKLVDMEIKVEDALTSPMPGMKNLLSKLKIHYKLIAVSDTYLPTDILEGLLKSAGLDHFFERIYCSCEYKLNKGSGRLFGKILETEGISPDEIIHIGDNTISDYFIPKGLGINSILLFDEWNLKRRKLLQKLQNWENRSDFWKGYSFINKLQSAEKQKDNRNSPESEFYYWGKNIVGPILTLYIHSFITEIQKEKIERFYFVARDGFILQKIFNILSDRIYGGGIGSPNYIYLSRYTSFISSIKNFSKRELELAIFGDNTSVKNVMDRLGLGESKEANEILEKYNIDTSTNFSYQKLKKTIKTLIAKPEFNNVVINHSREMRKLLEKYLRQEGIFSSKDGRIAIVDIGWLGTIQSCIEHAFSEFEDFPSITGYYLALNPPLFDLSVNKKGLICDYRNSTPDERAMIFFREALELPCRPDHGATIGYEEQQDGTVLPLFADNTNEKIIIPHIQNIQRGIIDFAEEYANLISVLDINPNELKSYVVKHYNTYLGYPTAESVKAFEQLSNADDFGSENIRAIVRNFSIRDFLNYREFRKSLAEIPWKEGSLSKSNIPFIVTCYNLAKRVICWNLTKHYINEQNPD